MKTDTAHLAWDSRWGTEHGRAAWLTPEPDVVALTEELARTKGSIQALDHGCGIGRHALHLARLGFSTTAVDLAENGLAELRLNAERESLRLDTKVAPMTALPFPDASFDYVLSFNVIYHGDGAIGRTAIAEIRRVLKPDGIFQGTMLSKRNADYGIGTEVAVNTFVRERTADDPQNSDKHHPHFYCNAGELITQLGGMELRSLVDREQDSPGDWHWHFIAENRSRP